MLFVPSERGISHSPDEYTSPEHCELGARVVARSLELLVQE
jgi:acetylornithine deacetylase/succinyl-diaminopimelate desuccinylase-like protein